MKLRLVLLLGLVPLGACATGAGSTGGTDDDGSTSAGPTVGSGGATTGTSVGGSSTTSLSGGSGGSGCPEGYAPSGGDCVDIDECAEQSDDCDPLVDCVNQEPGYQCGSCPTGTSDVNGDGTECADIDECAEQSDNCDPLAACINDTPGFHCGPCPNGTTDVNGDGTLCTSSNVIGLDDRHGYDAISSIGSGSHHAQFRTAIQNQGKTISALASLEAANLIGLRALFVQQPYTHNSSPFTATEVAAIVAFVNGGGGLVMFGDGGSGGDQANLNLLAQNWGVTYSSTNQWPSGLVVSSLVAHPITTGVTSIGLDYGVPMTTVNAPAVPLTSSGSMVLAAVTGAGGSGNVVFLSDSLFNNSDGSDYNINSLSNAQLLNNILAFVAP